MDSILSAKANMAIPEYGNILQMCSITYQLVLLLIIKCLEYMVVYRQQFIKSMTYLRFKESKKFLTKGHLQT